MDTWPHICTITHTFTRVTLIWPHTGWKNHQKSMHYSFVCRFGLFPRSFVLSVTSFSCIYVLFIETNIRHLFFILTKVQFVQSNSQLSFSLSRDHTPPLLPRVELCFYRCWTSHLDLLYVNNYYMLFFCWRTLIQAL